MYVSEEWCKDSVTVIRTLQALQTAKLIQACKLTDAMMTAAVSTTVRHMQPGCHRMRPPLGCCLTPRAGVLATAGHCGSVRNSVLESRPKCSVDTAKLKENEIAEAEKIAVERECSLHQVKSFTQDLRS